MPSETFKSLTRTLLTQAQADGVRPPVLASLGEESWPAQEIYCARHLAHLPTEVVNLPEVPAMLEAWTAGEAAELLRGHAGVGGAAAANLVEALGRDVGWWLLEFQRSSLRVNAYAGRRLFEAVVPYDRVLDVFCSHCQKEASGRNVLHCHLPQGHQTVVCGRTPRESMEAINLLWVAATRTLPAVGNGAVPPLVLKNDDLSGLLIHGYETKPHVVAEAIRALRKVPGGLDAWIAQVLNATPELDGLAAAVRRELHGDGA